MQSHATYTHMPPNAYHASLLLHSRAYTPCCAGGWSQALNLQLQRDITQAYTASASVYTKPDTDNKQPAAEPAGPCKRNKQPDPVDSHLWVVKAQLLLHT